MCLEVGLRFWVDVGYSSCEGFEFPMGQGALRGWALMKNSDEPTGWAQYKHVLTEALAPYMRTTVFVGGYTNNGWAASCNPCRNDGVHFIAE